LLDTATLKEKWKLPFQENFADVSPNVFSPNSRWLTSTKQRRDPAPPQKDWHTQLDFIDVARGLVAGSFENPTLRSHFLDRTFFPNGERLAVGANGHIGQLQRIFILDVPSGKMVHEILLPKKASFRNLALSPDGKWLAIMSQEVPEGIEEGADAEDWPQAELRIVEAATGRVREILFAPAGYASSVRFSPNGRILATGGHGRVALWDFSSPPRAMK
jgi:WD40 repeat protein